MADKVAQIRPTGLKQDALPGHDHYSTADNMIMRDGMLERPARDPGALTNNIPNAMNTPLHLLEYETESQANFWLLSGNNGGTGELIVSAAAENKDITPTTWPSQNNNRVTSGTLNNTPFINSSVAEPVTWGGDYVTPTAAVILTGWFTDHYAWSMRAFDTFLVAMNIFDTSGTPDVRFPDEIRWSDRAAAGAGLPTAWTATATNEAGSATVGLGGGWLRDGMQLGHSFMLYKDESTFIMNQTGLPEVMTIRPVLTHSGIMAVNCVAPYRGGHVVLTGGDVILTDGRDAQSIIDSSNRRWLFDNIDDARRDECYVVAHPRKPEIWVCFATAAGLTYCDTALIWDGSAWGVRELGTDNTADDGNGNDGYPHMVSGLDAHAVNAGKQLLAVDPDNADTQFNIRVVGGESSRTVPMTVEVTGIALEPQQRSIVRRVYPVGRDMVDCNITLGTSDGPDDTITWGSATAWTASGEVPVLPSSSGRYHAIRYNVPNTQAGTPRLEGFDILYTPEGRW